MTSYDTRSTYSSGAPRPSASTTESNDIKKLKSKYGSSLATLKELFHTWSDEDLLFAIQDAEGDLELTIDRITEGHANQWDQVKTKKSKKETNRSKAAAAVNTSPTSSSSSSYQRDKVNDRSYTTTTRNPSDRAGVKSRSANSNVTSRGSAGQRGAQGTIQSFSHQPTSWKSANHSTTHPATTTTSNNDTLSHASKPSSSNTWASIASIPKHETETSASFSELNNGDGWETGHDRWPSYTLASSETPMPQSKSMHDISAAFTSPTMSSSQSLSTITATPATTKNAAKSWASLLKTKPATEPLQITPESSQTNKQTSSNHQENAPAQDAWTGEAPEESQTTSTEDAWSAPVDVNAAWKSQDTVSWGEEKKDESTDNVAPATHDSEPSFVSEKDPLSAGLTQSFAHEGVPAVVPKDKSTVDGVNIKFGSLSLDESTSASQPPSRYAVLLDSRNCMSKSDNHWWLVLLRSLIHPLWKRRVKNPVHLISAKRYLPRWVRTF
ncbi:uncharacterized protein BYT42DRAFT_171536 [Radiomyces spectabilis]|uniref:uncharacterized protein n=1 Tax=Radiomyces spectabilis TaxID=64574 RepID=UPI002220BFC5|nr:uncharacterized protein BYT42DRAFT_171536 [Radiomyces spectabilis]KAI8390834.1 hypothetical protein BYT42DRAFT_171536 [Radiomyces spectabilis]